MLFEGFYGVLVNIVLIIFFVIAFHYVYLLWNSDYWKKRGVFCPDSKALFGNLPGQVTGKRNIMYDLDDLYQEYKDKFSYIGIYQFREPRLLVFDPNMIKDIMIKNFKNFQGTELHGKFDKTSDPLFGNHPFILVGDEWKNKRNEMTPAFTNMRIKAIFPITEDVNSKMINYIKQEMKKPNFDGFDAKDLASRFTISVVSNSIYNVDSKSFEGHESEILKTSQTILAPTKKFIIAQILTSVYPFLSKYLKISLTSPEATKFFIDLMNNALKYRRENNIQRIDYLDHLINLKNKKEISDVDIAGHGASFLIDGYDTTSSVISAALVELGSNREAQQKLREEINEKMPNDEDFTYENILNLRYLDQVWSETLRLRFPGTHFTRMCNEPVELDLPKDKKLFFEKNLVIIFPLASIQMDPEFFPNPTQFDPDRFAPENGGLKSFVDQGVFLPFGIGPRACPGSRFAIAQGKIAIASLVRNFEISLNPKSPKEFVVHPQAFIVTYPGIVDLKEIKRS